MAWLLAARGGAGVRRPARPRDARRLQSRQLPKALHRADRHAEQLGDAELGHHRVRLARVQVGVVEDPPQALLAADLLHRVAVAEVADRAAEPLGHIPLRLLQAHPAGHLHARDQVSGRTHPAHARGERVGDVHASGVTRAHLQPVAPEDVDVGLGRPRRRVLGRVPVHRHAADALADVGVHGDAGDVHARLGHRDRVGRVPGAALAGADVHRRPEDGGAGILAHLELLLRPEPGEPPALPLELAVDADHELAGHADLDAGVRVLLAQVLHRAEGAEEVGVAGAAGGVEVHAVGAGVQHALAHVDEVLGGVVHGLVDGRAGAGDVAARQQLEPVVRRARRACCRRPGWAARRTARAPSSSAGSSASPAAGTAGSS